MIELGKLLCGTSVAAMSKLEDPLFVLTSEHNCARISEAQALQSNDMKEKKPEGVTVYVLQEAKGEHNVSAEWRRAVESRTEGDDD